MCSLVIAGAVGTGVAHTRLVQGTSSNSITGVLGQAWGFASGTADRLVAFGMDLAPEGTSRPVVRLPWRSSEQHSHTQSSPLSLCRCCGQLLTEQPRPQPAPESPECGVVCR